MSSSALDHPRARIFISYARDDAEFVRRLRAALVGRGIDAHGDWLLTAGEDYAARLKELNLGAQAFLFVISPDSIASDACRSELAVAVEHKKHILPISHRDHHDDNRLDSALRAPQWTFLRDHDDFGVGVESLVKAINTDFALMDMHARLLVAADQWSSHGRNPSYLLRKDVLKRAETWLATASAQPEKLPRPTPLEAEFILASQKGRSRAARIALGTASGVALALAVVSAIALYQRSTAVSNAERLRLSSSETDYRAANGFLREGDVASAVAYLARALEANPANTMAATRLFTLLTARDQPVLTGHVRPTGGRITAFDVSSDGLLAMLFEGGTAALWKENTQMELDLGGRKAIAVRFLSPRKSLVVVTSEGAVLLFGGAGPKPSAIFDVKRPIVQYALSDHAERMAVACTDGSVSMVPLQDAAGLDVQEVPVPRQQQVRAMAFIKNDAALAIASAEGLVAWEFRTAKIMAAAEFRNSLTESDLVAIAANGLYSLTRHDPGGLEEAPYYDVEVGSFDPAGQDETGDISDPSKGWALPRYEFATAIDLDVDPAGAFVVATLDTDEAHLLRPTGEDTLLRHEGVTRAGVHPQGSVVYTASRDGSVRLWDGSTGVLRRAPLWHRRAVGGGVFSHSGDHLVTVTDDGTLHVWDISHPMSKAERVTLVDEAGETSSSQEQRSRDTRFLLVRRERDRGSDVEAWELLDASTRKTLRTYRHRLPEDVKEVDGVWESFGIFPTTGAALSSDGSTVVTIAGSSPALVWRGNSDSPRLALAAGSRSYAEDIRLSPTADRVLISYTAAGKYKRSHRRYEIFSLGTGGSLAAKALREDQSLLDVSSDLSRIIVGEGVSAHIRDAYDGHIVGERVAHGERIAAARFNANGRAFGTVSRDGTLRVWDADTGFPLSDPLVFNPTPPSFNGPPWEDDYFSGLRQPVFVERDRRVAISDPATPTTRQMWDISLDLSGSDGGRLAEIATLIFGARLNANGIVESAPQLSLSELRTRFAAYEPMGRDLHQLVAWLMTPGSSRSATPFGASLRPESPAKRTLPESPVP